MKYELDYYDFDVISNTFGEDHSDKKIVGFEGNGLQVVGNVTFNNKE